MANINGTNLAAPVVPFTTDDTFPTHYAKYGKGGYRTVATITERDGIFTALREEGMEVYVVETSKKYALVGGISNTNWVERISNVAGSNTQVMFNDNGVLAGSADLTYNKLSRVFKAGNTIREVSSSQFLHGAGNSFVTGAFNLGVGFNALKSVTSGENNIAVGGEALNSVTTGYGNTALGYGALGNGNGILNFGLGYEAGRDCTGIRNIFLGSYAGNTETSISNRLIVETHQTRNSNKDYLIEGDFNYRWIRFNGALRKRVVNITSTSSLNSGTATSATTNSVTDTTKTFVTNEFQNKFLIITGGVGVGQAMLITSNTATTITTTKNFTITPDNTSIYKIISGTTLLGENLNTEYFFDLTTEDYVVNLPTIDATNYSGGEVSFILKTNPNGKKLYILTNGTNLILPDNTQTKSLKSLYQKHTFSHTANSWLYNKQFIKCLQPISTTTKDLQIDLNTELYKLDVATATTVTLNIDSTYIPILTNNALTIELHINMTVASTITWPGNISWIGGSAPAFNEIKKYAVVLRTMDAGTTWIANLAYTY